MTCADVQTIQAGNGSKTQFSFDFPYIFKSEIQVSFWNTTTKEWDVIAQNNPTYPWQVTDANPTIVEFTGTAPPTPTVPSDPGETAVDNVRIRRVTNIDDIRAIFNPGSAIRSDDLNKNFEQLRYAIQESNCQGITDDVDQYLKDYYWSKFDNSLYSGETWVSDDATLATTERIDERFSELKSSGYWDDRYYTEAELTASQNNSPLDARYPQNITSANYTFIIGDNYAWLSGTEGIVPTTKRIDQRLKELKTAGYWETICRHCEERLGKQRLGKNFG